MKRFFAMIFPVIRAAQPAVLFCRKAALLLMAALLCCTAANAQPTGPGGGSPFPDPGCDLDAQCPIDAWVFPLAIGAVVFAAIQLRKKHKALA